MLFTATDFYHIAIGIAALVAAFGWVYSNVRSSGTKTITGAKARFLERSEDDDEFRRRLAQIQEARYGRSSATAAVRFKRENT